MKVIYYTDSQVTGGAEKYLILLLSHLPKKIKPFVICHRKQKRLIKKLEKKRIQYNPLATPSKIFFWQIIPLYKLFKKQKTDIIHFQFWSPYCGLFGLLAARLAGLKTIISTEHSLVPLKEAKFYEIPLKSIYLSYRNKITKALITSSYASKKIMVKSHGFDKKKIKVIYNALETNGQTRGSDVEDKNTKKIREKREGGHIVVGTVARLEDGKGHLPLLRTIREILKVYPKTLFVFVGGGSLAKKLKAQSSKLKINKNILFTGERKNVDTYLKLFDIFAFPSLSENFPYAILEAERVSLPIVAFEVGGINEEVEDNVNGYLINKGDFKLFKSKIIKLIKSKRLREKMGEKSLGVLSDKFNIKNSVLETVKIYKKCSNS